MQVILHFFTLSLAFTWSLFLNWSSTCAPHFDAPPRVELNMTEAFIAKQDKGTEKWENGVDCLIDVNFSTLGGIHYFQRINESDYCRINPSFFVASFSNEKFPFPMRLANHCYHSVSVFKSQISFPLINDKFPFSLLIITIKTNTQIRNFLCSIKQTLK